MTPEEHKARVRRVIDEAYGKGNLDALDEVNAPDAVWHQPPGPDLKGMDAYKQMITSLRSALSDFRFTVDEFIVEGDINAMRWTIQGTRRKEVTPGHEKIRKPRPYQTNRPSMRRRSWRA
jgi:ketosteroid isomerase-like protein